MRWGAVDVCCVCRKRAVGSSLSGQLLCADHWEWAESEAAGMAEEQQPKRKYTKPLQRPIFEDRICEHEGCSVVFKPIGAAAKYCPEHADARLVARRQWRQLEILQLRRAMAEGRLLELLARRAS